MDMASQGRAARAAMAATSAAVTATLVMPAMAGKVEVPQARAEAAAARQSLDEANQLQEELAGHKSRLEAEVELLKAEAAKVVEAQQALAEADQ